MSAERHDSPTAGQHRPAGLRRWASRAARWATSGWTTRRPGALLNAALDAGLTLVDTAPGYGASEERIGRHLAHRRREFLLSTKCGYGVPGVPDWTPGCITQGVDQALRTLRTNVLDILHLHSCPVDVLQRPGLVEALEAAVRAGKVRVAAYSGENEALACALEDGRFGSVQAVAQPLRPGQRARRPAARPRARAGRHREAAAGQRRLACPERPGAPDVATYWERMHALALDLGGLDPAEAHLRFAAFQPGVSTCIVGTTQRGEPPAQPARPGEGPAARGAWWTASGTRSGAMTTGGTGSI